jgi:hypothetical protein
MEIVRGGRTPSPGKRMLSSMTYDRARLGEAPMLVTGAAGGAYIITAVAHLIVSVIDFGKPLGGRCGATVPPPGRPRLAAGGARGWADTAATVIAVGPRRGVAVGSLAWVQASSEDRGGRGDEPRGRGWRRGDARRELSGGRERAPGGSSAPAPRCRRLCRLNACAGRHLPVRSVATWTLVPPTGRGWRPIDRCDASHAPGAWDDA